jgi:hypothetical protein
MRKREFRTKVAFIEVNLHDEPCKQSVLVKLRYLRDHQEFVECTDDDHDICGAFDRLYDSVQDRDGREDELLKELKERFSEVLN